MASNTGKAGVIVAPDAASPMDHLAHAVLDDLLYNTIHDILIKAHRDEKMARATTAVILAEKLASDASESSTPDSKPDVRIETDAAIYEDGKVTLKGNPLKTTKDILCPRCHLPRLLHPTDGKGARKPDPGVVYCKKVPYIDKPGKLPLSSLLSQRTHHLPHSTSPIPWAPFLVRSHRGRRYLWEIRHLITEEWAVKLKLHGFSNEKFSIQFSHILGFLLACAVVAAYHVTNHMVLSNFLGYGLCYGTFLIMSPTTFPTGTLILCGLFVYDIVMVFYTPYMITVATKLDAPIKLTFASAAKSSILGLGDIVVPGMVMALALRFDLWRFYNKQVKYVATELKSKATGPTSDDVVVASEIQHMAKKTPYIDVTGSWADRFWVSTWPGLLT
ncbi:hypothetical protein BN1723_018855, partial [Verticillium longisporum]